MPQSKELVGKNSVAWRLVSNNLVIARSPLIKSLDELPVESTFQPSYHFACGLDDLLQRHQVIVRGADLAPARFDQTSIYDTAYETGFCSQKYRPVFVHARMVLGRQGERLEKRSLGVTLADLAHTGVSPSEIVDRFQKSMSPIWIKSTTVNPGEVYDEPGKSLTLQDLGF